jgi:uncharacterized repeat protein (TIGR03809 family)
MSARQALGPYDSVARKWLALAERRKLHMIELYDSGRWRRYYTEAKLLAEMRGAIEACDAWARIVGVPPQAAAPVDTPIEAADEAVAQARPEPPVAGRADAEPLRQADFEPFGEPRAEAA